MSSSTPQQQDQASPDDEAALAMTTPSTTEAALIADFDRYIHVDADAQTPFQRLVARYPTFDPEVLREILTSCDGDEEAASGLLQDAAPLTDSDAALAKQLQRREKRRAQSSSRQSRPVPTAPIKLESPAMEQMVSTLRETVVPALRAHFGELVFPDMHDTSAGIDYSLEKFQVAALSLPEDNISVKAATDGRSIRVTVVNVYLELEVGKWSYERKGLVPVKDTGTARVSIYGMSVSLQLQPRLFRNGSTKACISECNVVIDGVVRFKTKGATADWAYNAIAVVMKPLVVSYIKDAVSDTVTEALAAHLRLWVLASSAEKEKAAHDPETGSTSQLPGSSESPDPAQSPPDSQAPTTSPSPGSTQSPVTAAE